MYWHVWFGWILHGTHMYMYASAAQLGGEGHGGCCLPMIMALQTFFFPAQTKRSAMYEDTSTPWWMWYSFLCVEGTPPPPPPSCWVLDNLFLGLTGAAPLHFATHNQTPWCHPCIYVHVHWMMWWGWSSYIERDKAAYRHQKGSINYYYSLGILAVK